MTTPTGQNTPNLAQDLIQTLDDLSGLHPGHRPAHAKGRFFSGTFTPSPEAASLTRAPHIERESTPVTVRFSNSTGVPTIPDNDPNTASPRGMAIRFHLAEHVHTDIIAHSHNGFPVRTPEEFLEFLRAVVASRTATSSPTPIEAFLADHPKALLFVQTPKPIPTSFAGEAYFGVNAFQFTNKDGATRFGRYRILPEYEGEYLDNPTAATKTGNFLFDEIDERVAQGPVQYQVVVQLAEEGDTVDDATALWPEDRPQLTLGTITITGRLSEEDSEQRRMIFDPIPRVAGIDPSDDPLLETRADVYLMSGRRRRAAGEKPAESEK
jgi:catalase